MIDHFHSISLQTQRSVFPIFMELFRDPLKKHPTLNRALPLRDPLKKHPTLSILRPLMFRCLGSRRGAGGADMLPFSGV